MQNYRIYYIGTEQEVAHHAAPLLAAMDVKIVEPGRAVDLAQTGDLAIFYSEHFHRFRDCWRRLNDKRCHTLYAIDGILEWRNAWENREHEPACPWTMRPVLSDKVACIGASQARILDSWGNQGKTEIVGLPRLDGFASFHRSQTRENEPIRLLVSSAKTPGFTTWQTQNMVRALRDLKDFVARQSPILGRPLEICWRLTGELPSAVGIDNASTDTTGKDLQRVLQTVDAVITTPSTVLLESMLAGLPTCILDYTNSPRYVDAAWSITAADQIRDAISQITQPSPRRLQYQQTLMNDALFQGEPATQRFQRLVEEMIRHGHDCRAGGQEVVFPSQILPVPATPASFNPTKLFPHQSSEPVPSTAQLAHIEEMRRYIQVLEQRVRVVEQALEQAEDVIAGIHRHPVLGPLVKLGDLAKSLGAVINGKPEPKSGPAPAVAAANKPTKSTSAKPS